MGCGQSRPTRRFQQIITICRNGSLKEPNLSRKILLRDHDHASSSGFDPQEAMALPERPKVKVTVAPHLRLDEPEEEAIKSRRVAFRDEEEMEEEEEDESDGWIGKPGSPSFRIYLVESVFSDEEEEDDYVKDGGAEKTSLNEDKSAKNPRFKEGSEAKSRWKGRRLMEVVRKGRLSMTSCCNSSHQQTVHEQRGDQIL